MYNPFETAVPAVLVGLFLEAILFAALMRTGQGKYAVFMGVVLLAVLGAVVVERLVITERERVEMTLEDARAAVVANDYPRLEACIDPAAQTVRRMARSAMDRVQFTDGHIRGLEITLTPPDHPTQAEARFSVLAAFTDRRGESPYQNYLANLVVKLNKSDKAWLVTDVVDTKFGSPPGGR